MSIEEHERVLRELSLAKAVFLFVFSRGSFERLALKHDIASNITGAKDIREAYLNGKYNPREDDTRKLVEFRTSGLRASLLRSGLAVLLVGLLSGAFGFATYLLAGVCPVWLSAILQAAGVGVILWATLWELGWNLRSMDGHTLTERVHQWLFRVMYSLGSALFFFAYVWSVQW